MNGSHLCHCAHRPTDYNFPTVATTPDAASPSCAQAGDASLNLSESQKVGEHLPLGPVRDLSETIAHISDISRSFNRLRRMLACLLNSFPCEASTA
jgi:hypothetical protein